MAKTGTFGNGFPPDSKELIMAKTKTLTERGNQMADAMNLKPATSIPDNKRNLIILFSRDGLNYRMRVACVHVHPGERDLVEVQGKTMLGGENWTPVPDGHIKIPSSEWLIRRALWMDFTHGMNTFNNNEMATIELGEI